MARTLADLATWVEGTLIGDGATLVAAAAPLAVAGPGEITMIDSTEKSQRSSVGSKAAAAIVPRDFQPDSLPAIQVDDVHAAFAKIVSFFRPQAARPRPGVHAQAIVSSTARIAHNATVMAGATVGDNVEIGPGSIIHSGVHLGPGCRVAENVTIFPNAVLYEHTTVGARAIIHSGVVLGAYGFGYKLVDGCHQLSAQLGYVAIEADVEIGANTTIDRGTYGPTVIGEGTKIDNQVMIGHNCRLGRHNLICSQVGIAGSTSTGDYVVMAGQVGVRDHVHIGNRVVIGAKSGVSNDIADGARVLGLPAIPEREAKLQHAVACRLPELRQQLKALDAAVRALQLQQTTHGPADQAAA